MIVYLVAIAGIILLVLLVVIVGNKKSPILIVDPVDWVEKWQLAKWTLPDESKKLLSAFTAASLSSEEPLDKILHQLNKKTKAEIIVENKIAPLTVQRIFGFERRTYSMIVGLIDDCCKYIRYYKSKKNLFDKKYLAKLQQEGELSNANGFLTISVSISILHQPVNIEKSIAHTYIGSLIMEPKIIKDRRLDTRLNKLDKLRLLSILPAKLVEWLIKDTPLQSESVLSWRMIRSLPFVRQDEEIQSSIIIASADEEALYRVKKEWNAL